MSYPEIAALLIALVWFISVAKLRALNEWHHFYGGAWFFIAGNEMAVDWLALAGLIVMLDDMVAHVVQASVDPTFEGPLFRLYKRVWPHLPKWLQL